MKDRFGREIRPGHAIAYAGTSGRSAALDFYKVERVESNSVRGFKYSYWRKEFSKTASSIGDGNRAMTIPIEDLELLTP